MTDDRRERAEGRFPTLVLCWLNSLPPAGWEGTSHELGEALAAFAERKRLMAYVPTCPGRQVADLSGFLADHGFTLTPRRTKRERTLRFSPAGSHG